MKRLETEALACCHRLERILRENEPETWQKWLRSDWDLQADHGPRYSPSEWFGPIPNSERVARRRAIQRLEKQGLLRTWRRWDALMTNVQLTPEGNAFVQKQLTEDADWKEVYDSCQPHSEFAKDGDDAN